MKDNEKLYAISEAAEVLGMGVQSVRRRIAAGRIDSIYRHGETFVPHSAIEKYRKRKRDRKTRDKIYAASVPIISFVFMGISALLFMNAGRIRGASESSRDVRNLLSEAVSSKTAGDYERAVELLSEVIERNPDLETAYKEMGVVRNLMGDADGAIQAYEKAMALNDRDPDLKYALALTYFKAGEAVKAAELAHENLEANPSHYLSIELSGQLRLEKGEMDLALESFRELERMHPDYPGGPTGMGEVFMRIGDTEKAIEKFSRAISSDPRYLRAYSNRALCYLSLEKYVEAEKDYLALIELAPGALEAWNNIALVYLRLLRPRDALIAAFRALELAPGNPGVIDTLGWVLFHLQDYNNALAYLERAYAISPQSTEILFHLGMIHLRLGHKDEAENYCQLLHSMAPESKAASMLRTEIQASSE